LEIVGRSVGYWGGRKTGEPGKKPTEEGENQQQTQPTYGTGLKLNLGHTGGRLALSTLHHPCSPETFSGDVENKCTWRLEIPR